MEKFPQFIKIGNDRIKVEEIVNYGFAFDEDDDRYLYVETRTGDGALQYYDEEVDFDLEDKVAELDNLFLIN
ncbi:MAG: hypothetical protein II857_07160 [Selenomonadaceae bacterium]|nr:hypothetical protein [Selenomonadaceae bacterium]